MTEINWGLVATAFRQSGHIAAVTELKRQGYVIVPIEPTSAMDEAGCYAVRDDENSATNVYRAMLSASPVI
jgi:predicted CoA-binding protein